MTLTRRDRAALTLALECVRLSFGCVWHTNAHSVRAKHAVSWATGTLSVASGHGRAPVLDDLFEALDDEEVSRVPPRLLRARLALLLRAVLRADEYERSDHGWNFETPPVRTVVCDGCRGRLPWHDCGEVVERCPLGGRHVARYARPLWEDAPETRR